MNYLLLLVGTHLALTNLGDIKPNSTEWQSYKLEHGKSYDDHKEDSMRSLIFTYNKLKIDELNSKLGPNSSFNLGVNHLADLSELELKAMNGFKASEAHLKMLSNSAKSNKILEDILNDDSISVPEEVDWRKVPGRVSEVKNQGNCGSCWAFATTGVLEGQEKKILGKGNGTDFNLVELSEQELLDCDEDDNGCGGGNPINALNNIRELGGIVDEDSYPYRARSGACRFNKTNKVITDAGAVVLPTTDEQTLKEVVAKFGPVAVAIYADSSAFRYYEGGVFYMENCPSSTGDLDHAVLVVGYGTEYPYGDFWIVKNSWSDRYGEDGYIRMARNRGNNCGIATMPMIPTF